MRRCRCGGRSTDRRIAAAQSETIGAYFLQNMLQQFHRAVAAILLVEPPTDCASRLLGKLPDRGFDRLRCPCFAVSTLRCLTPWSLSLTTTLNESCENWPKR